MRGYYRGRLGQAGPGEDRRAPPLFFDPGELTLTGSGGEDVGAFQVSFHAPRHSNGLIVILSPRSIAEALLVHWHDPSGGHLIVILPPTWISSRRRSARAYVL